MVKNLFLLGLLTWVTLSYANKDHSVAHDSMADAEAYKLEKGSAEQEAKRSLAGGKVKKQKPTVQGEEAPKSEPTETDSEVRYWQYSE